MAISYVSVVSDAFSAMVSCFGGPLGLCKYCTMHGALGLGLGLFFAQYLHNPSGPPIHETRATFSVAMPCILAQPERLSIFMDVATALWCCHPDNHTIYVPQGPLP